MKKYFEYIGETDRTKTGETAKFWEITLEGKTVSVRFGKLGTNGQGSIKELDSEDSARAYADKKIAEKTKDGYVEKQHQAERIARGNLMNRWCGCGAKAKSGNIEGIEFEVCTSCEKLSWEPTKTKNFIDASFSLSVDLEDPSAAEDTIGNFVTWLDEVLASYDFGPKSTWKMSVTNYSEEEFSIPVDEGVPVDISLIIADWNFDVIEDGEESGYSFIDPAELDTLSGEDLVKRAVRNLWSHMNDYQLYEIAKMVMEHIEGQRFSSVSKPTSQANIGSPVLVSFEGMQTKGFPERWGVCHNGHGFCSGCDPRS
jgi:predicted DNA-binding WGR domain protein